MAFKESEIQKMMKSLDLTREEAIQLLQDDADDVTAELTPEQEKVAASMVRTDRKVETTPRKRERKPDENKRLIIDFLNSNLIDFCHDFDENCIDDDVIIINPEREIEFTFKGERYRLTLAKPRVKKD